MREGAGIAVVAGLDAHRTRPWSNASACGSLLEDFESGYLSRVVKIDKAGCMGHSAIHVKISTGTRFGSVVGWGAHSDSGSQTDNGTAASIAACAACRTRG